MHFQKVAACCADTVIIVRYAVSRLSATEISILSFFSLCIPSFTAILLIQHILVESFTRVIIVALSSSIILVVLSYYVLLDKENKKKVKALILNKLKR